MVEKLTRRKEWRDGKSDKFVPLESLDLNKIKTVDDMVRAMSKTAFAARSLGEAADVLEKMVRDEDCFVVLTLSGAMTVAKMGLVVCDMIDRGMVHAVVSTGALMAHGFIESTGMTHFKYEMGQMNDRELYLKGYDRVYDTLELEKNLDDAETIIMKLLDKWDRKEPLCSWKFNRLLGEYLMSTKGRGVLKSALQNGVPVFVPAFTDSEFGLDVGMYNIKQRMKKKSEITFNPLYDLDKLREIIGSQKKVGIFTIGGGVPRNWAQQIGPYMDIIENKLGKNAGGGFVRYHYGVRICPEPVHWGGLSGCTYSEGVAWGKFVPKEEGGMWAEVLEDATVAWPLIVKAVMERLEKTPPLQKNIVKPKM